MTSARTVLITGGAQGIGWATAQRFLADGWQVIVGDVKLDGAGSAGAVHKTFSTISLDVTDQASVDTAFATIMDRFGGLDVLVNNAGIQQWTPLAEVDWSVWNAVIEVNLNGALRCLSAAGRMMIAAGHGAIVNVVSIGAERGVMLRGPYGAAKAGLVNLTKTAAVEWAKLGVRVNAVGPGYVETELVQKKVTTGELDPAQVTERIPMGRMAQTSEIAEAIHFLASDRASYVTGHVLFVDGGFLANSGVSGTLEKDVGKR